MLPQPMMPMSMRSMERLNSHAADESVAGTRGLRRISGLVMLDHHPPRARRPGGLPQVPPIQHAGADIRPAVLVLVLTLRRDILHVRDRKSTRLKSRHRGTSYAVLCLKKEKH